MSTAEISIIVYRWAGSWGPFMVLTDAKVPFTYYDVVKEPRALYEMIARVKPIIGPKTPVTVPQIWLDEKYIGGKDQLNNHLKAELKFTHSNFS